MLQDIERAYNNNPYHNNIHAADVTQTLGCFLANDQFAQKLTDLEIASMIFATCIHDVGHPGLLPTSLSTISMHLQAVASGIVTTCMSQHVIGMCCVE